MNNPLKGLLVEMVRDLRERDPLLKRGIERDWVCVINPALVNNIIEYYKHNPMPFASVPISMGNLHIFMGRRVFIIEDAPITTIEYMPEEAMYNKYHEHFKRVEEWLKSRADTPEDPST